MDSNELQRIWKRRKRIFQRNQQQGINYVVKPRKLDMTPRREEVLSFICQYITQNHCSPSHTDILVACHFSSLAAVNHQLVMLERLGKIKRAKGISRGIELL